MYCPCQKEKMRVLFGRPLPELLNSSILPNTQKTFVYLMLCLKSSYLPTLNSKDYPLHSSHLTTELRGEY